MIHPSDLLRSDSRSKQFTAPIGLLGQSDNDWGIYICPCLAKLFNWRTFAKPSLFTFFLSLIGFVQGFLLLYFRKTSEIWSRQYGIPKETSEWMIYSDEFIVGLVALPISYWASITHKIRWISVITIGHAIFSMSLFVPERLFAKRTMLPDTNVFLCGDEFPTNIEDVNIAAFIYVIAYQISNALASVAFYSLGLVYMDENIVRNKPAVLAVALASRLLGQQFGIYVSWFPNWFNDSQIFRSFIWQIACFIYVVLTIGIAMFPKTLPSLLIKRLANSLLEIASGTSSNEMLDVEKDGFLIIMKRISKSKIIILSIVSAVAIQSAQINFGIFDNYFKQSRFLISDNFDEFGFNNSFSLDLVVNVMEKPLAIMALIIAGLVISMKRTKVKYLILWNIAAYSLATLMFCGNLFSKCEYDDMTQLIPSCSVDCGCSLDGTFNPVCLKGRTYYSPCHAGCKTIEVGEYSSYGNCTCASFEGRATEGSCHLQQCRLAYQISQVNNVAIRGILSTCMVTNIVIVMRLMRGIDKSVTLGLEMSLMSLIPFLPVRWLYQFASEKLCKHWHQGKCRVYSPQLSNFLSNATLMLMVVATITQMLLLSTKLEGLEKPLRMRKVRKYSEISSRRDASVNFESDVSDSQPMNHASLVSDFDSLGDDHDSCEEIIDGDASRKVDAEEVLESHL